MIKKISKYKYIGIILLVAIITCIPLLWSNLDVYFDDGIQHISRAYASFLALQNGESPTVLSNLANEFGYSWDLFYGFLSTFIIIFCKLFTSTFINAYKLTLFLGLLLSRIYYVHMCKFYYQK